MKRTAKITRNTSETQILVELNLDGSGQYKIETGIGFLNHMLELFARHSCLDLKVKAQGDLKFDDHHLIEDLAIVLGQAIKESIGDKKGINRYGSQILPMDEVLCLCAIDLSGRFAFESDYSPVREKVNDFSTEMFKHFFKSLALNAGMNLHIQYLNPGENEHHRLEAAFKAFARALREACQIDPGLGDRLPTTKNLL